MPRRAPLSGAILVGGRSARMGRDKALLAVDGITPLLTSLAATLSTRCDEVLLVGGDPGRFEHLQVPATWVPDGVQDVGPLGGILGALRAARCDACLVVACDMPFVTADLVAALADEPRDYLALAYPGPDGPEPLLAVYARACVAQLEAAIASGELQARRFLDRKGARSLSTATIARVDPGRRASTNLNTPEDLAAIF